MNDPKTILLSIGMTIGFGAQIVLAFVFYNPEGNAVLINTGWFVLMLSGVFGWLPIYTFRKKGNVQGRSYIHTTSLVDSGIYGIVRHPQYLAGILINIALPFISFHWSVVATGAIAAGLNYYSIFDEEKNCREKFGSEYEKYMKKVPRFNFILGICKIVRRKRN